GAGRVELTRPNPLSLVRFDGNDYSVPTAYAHQPITVVGGLDEVRLVCRDRLVARHRRHWGSEHVTFDPVHYLALLERKPGALDYARPLEEWHLPDSFAVLRRRFEAAWGEGGVRACLADKPADEKKADVQSVAKSKNRFALELYGWLREKDGNLFFSPYSIETALAMTYAGARGETAEQMAKTLHYDLPNDREHAAFAALIKQINAPGEKRGYQLSTA